MFDARTIFILAVSFLTDFLAGLATGLGAGQAGAAVGNGSLALAVSQIPSKYVVLIAIVGGLLAGLRGLQKNLAEPVASPSSIAGRMR